MANSPHLAVVFGCSGPVLGAEERAFFRDVDPTGFILFARNCESPEQVGTLVRDLRNAVGRDDAPVMIDQEGGRVTRLKPPHWRAAPAPGHFGEMAKMSASEGLDAAYLNARLIAADLYDLGISINCVPVLDIPQPGSSDVVGDRACGSDVETVIMLGCTIAQGMLQGGILPVIKHMPGHGRAVVDSHHELPAIAASWKELAAADFAPFRALRDLPWGMTGHILLEAIDKNSPATASTKVVQTVIREHIGFDGVLVTDDLSMNALEGTVGQRAARALAAGCDIALHCNGKMDEMIDVAASARPLSEAAMARIARAETMRRQPEPFDRNEAVVRLDELLRGKGA